MYQHGKRTRQPRSLKAALAAIAMVSATVLAGFYILHNDIANTTAPKTNVPIITEVTEGEEGEKLLVNEATFLFELPADWKLTDKRVLTGGASEYRWGATKKGADDRRLTLYVNAMPQVYKLVKMWPITPNGSKFILGNVSEDCREFAPVAVSENIAQQDNAPVTAKWENVTFLCDPIRNNQTIGTGTPGGTIGTTLSGSKGEYKFFFFYEDHNIHPDDNILRHVLDSFQAK